MMRKHNRDEGLHILVIIIPGLLILGYAVLAAFFGKPVP